MTYQNQFDIDFEYDGARYGATADVTVELVKRDVGPIGRQEQAIRYVADDVVVSNLSVGKLESGVDFVSIPEDLKFVAERELSVKAAESAEEFHELDR
jgi:hypothetical protein